MLAKRIYTVILFLLLYHIVFSQDEIASGLPFLTYYAFEEYNASPQNWDIVQAQNGVMYFANGDGILEFDGARWRLIVMPNKTVARSLDVSDDGTIYVGGYEDFGYLSPDDKGFLEFVSLKNKLPENTDYFQDVWTTKAIKNKVFFQTASSIFVLENDALNEIKAEYEFVWGSKSKDFFFTHDIYHELKIYLKNDLRKLKGSERFYKEDIYNVLDYKDGLSLVITGLGNVYICKIDTAIPKIEIIDLVDNSSIVFIKENGIYSGTNYNQDKICFATYYGGVLITDMQFNPLLIISKSFGLNNNNIRRIFKDKSDNLWLATDRGISFINMDLSLTLLNQYSNVSGSINDAIIFDDPNDKIPKRLYIASIERIFYKDLDSKVDPLDSENFQKFLPYDDFRYEVWKLYSYKNTLLCATSYGVYEIKDNTMYNLSPNASWSFTRINERPDLLLVNLDNGLDLLKISNGKWEYVGKIEGLDEYTSVSVFDDDNYLWVESISDGLYKLKLSENYDRVISKKTYSTAEGLPTKTLNFPYEIDDELKITTEKGIYQYKKDEDKFVPDSILNQLIGEIPLDYVFQAPNKNIWYTSTTTKSLGELTYQKNGTYTRDTSNFNEIKNLTIWNMYYYNDSKVFFCSPNGIILYDKTKQKKHFESFKTNICKVEIINNPDSIILLNPNSIKGEAIQLKYSQNALRFSYAVPFFFSVKNNQYSYSLEGFDQKDNWSPWTTQTEKEYNYLTEGKYTFHVKSRSVFMDKGNSTSYSFAISPPFYRTMLAQVIYALALSFLIYLVIVLNARRLRRANQKLEQRIAARTEEIRKQNDLLAEQKTQILKQHDELQSLNSNKDKFFSIIAHDLKNPFNTIIGFSELLMENIKNGDKDRAHGFAEVINNAAFSTYELLENLLSWSNIQRNNINFNPKIISLAEIIDNSIQFVNHNADLKQVKIHSLSDNSIMVFADHGMLSTVLRNLLTNAIKFSLKGGKIEINATKSDNEIIVSVVDEGIGIRKENKEKLFKLEENISTTGTSNEKGSGLGLVLCYEFIKVNQGKIWFESKEGKGSTFFFSVPIENHN